MHFTSREQFDRICAPANLTRPQMVLFVVEEHNGQFTITYTHKESTFTIPRRTREAAFALAEAIDEKLGEFSLKYDPNFEEMQANKEYYRKCADLYARFDFLAALHIVRRLEVSMKEPA